MKPEYPFPKNYLRLEVTDKQIHIAHWDEFFECERQFIIDRPLWEAMQAGDADAAWAVAESIAGQSPESLEIIAEYMGFADDLGSSDAHEWLRDYLSPGDIAEPYA